MERCRRATVRFQTGHTPQAATNRASVMRCRRSLLAAVGRCGCCHRCCHPRDASAPGTFPPGLRAWGAAPAPIGLTAADPFAGGTVSRADSRVRLPGTFPCPRCPAVTSALDAVPEAYHNPAAVWWGPFAPSRSCGRRGHLRAWPRPPRGFVSFPVRVLVDQVVTVNRGVRAVCPLETGSTGTFTQ
jgi:hypothetical protein